MISINSPDVLELPPCFRTWCKCGHKGRASQGFLYVSGMNFPIVDFSLDDLKAICPQCKKTARRDCSKSALQQRFRWAIDKFSAKLGREGGPFPCTCNPKPFCSVLSIDEIKLAVWGDTCFCGDSEWVRIAGTVKCNGCYAIGSVVLVERHNPRDVYDSYAGQLTWEG